MNAGLTGSILLPFLALGLQWLLWPWIAPFVWFLFFPAVFFSARLGGLRGGLTSTVLSIGIVWFFFLPPQLDWKLDHPPNFYSVSMFLFMGYLFSDSQERLRRAIRKTQAALAASEAAEQKITALYRHTLELDELKSQFFANVSHELRTPLTLILAPLDRRLRQTDDAAERQETELMLRNAHLLYRHVTDLLDAAKLDAGRMTLAWAQFDLAHLVRTMASHFDALAAERHIVYRLAVPDVLAVEADSEKLQRVLLNLLSNAFKFTPDGGTIALCLVQQGAYALLEVQDNGPGVPAHLRETVFERFRQVEGDARRLHGGTGLGLAIVRDFIELHGGSVALDEAPGGGALVSLRLPLMAPAGVTLGKPLPLDGVISHQAVEELGVHTPPSPVARIAPADAPLVLVVEDNLDMNQFIATLLRPFYRVACAFDGRDGMNLALALQPDLILSDVMMPVMSGDEMVEELRRQPASSDIPIVIVTAKADENLRLRLLQEGVEDYLSKPFSTGELLARVGNLINERRRTADKLCQSEATYHFLFDNMLNGLAYCQMLFEDDKPIDFVYLSVNPAFATLTGLRNATGRKVSEVIPGIRETDPELFEIYARVSLGGQPERLERYVKALRMWFWISVYSPKQNHFVAVFDVITERKQAEEEIRLLNADLERRVDLRTAELTRANRELDAFAYAVSHDLRTPLRAMSGFSQALAEDFGDILQGEARVYLDQIGLASRKMGELIDGILTLSRSTRSELHDDEIDLSAVAEHLLDELAQSEPHRRVELQVQAGLKLRGDARMLEVVMRNLLGNAWKYSAYTAEARIRVYAEERDGRQRFCVSDNGTGFDMAHANRLFQPFQRLHRQEEFPGTGIGLATVQRIIHRHGGAVEARGEPGKGAVFCFTAFSTSDSCLIASMKGDGVQLQNS